MEKESRYHCNKCNLSYSVTVKTIFHNTRVDLRKWFLMITMLVNARRKPSSRQMAKIVGVNKNTACYMAMRVRHWMLKDREFLIQLSDKVAK
jgi:transposase-like protein